jgi:hypothetical protein
MEPLFAIVPGGNLGLHLFVILLVSGLLSFAHLASPDLLRGQAPAGPMAPAEPKAPPPSAQTKDQQP